MLQPDYFTYKEDELLKIYYELEDFIMKDIARRLLASGEMTATADRLLYKLDQMGKHRIETEKQLAKITKSSQQAVRKVLQEAVMVSWADDAEVLKQMGVEVTSPLDNYNVRTVMDAEYKKTLGELNNLTRTTMEESQRELMNLMDKAEVRISAGVQSYSSAINDVLDEYAGKGTMVQYPTGTRMTLESAVRLCVVTSVNQTAGQVSNQYISEAKAEYVRVSAHIGARYTESEEPANHLSWQGKVYKIRGSEPDYPNLLETTGYDINPETGIGTVVNPLGLHGYNCRHSHQPWDKRLKLNVREIDPEESKRRYDNSQRQRAMERAIRKTKRRLIMKREQIKVAKEPEFTSLKNEYDRMANRLMEQNRVYNEFCQTTGLPPQYERNRVADFDATETKSANAAARRYKNGNK